MELLGSKTKDRREDQITCVHALCSRGGERGRGKAAGTAAGTAAGERDRKTNKRHAEVGTMTMMMYNHHDDDDDDDDVPLSRFTRI